MFNATSGPRYKILVISDYRSPIPARPEAEIFIRLAQSGHEVVVLSYPEASYYNERFRSVGIEVIEKHPTGKLSPSYIKYLRNFVRITKFDFVHVFNSIGLTNAVWALRGLPSKLIAYRGYAGQVHWYDPMMYFKYLHPRVDHIICNDSGVEAVMARNMPWAKHKLTIIYKGHNPEWFENVVPADRIALGFSIEDILICFIANVRPFKGLTWLLQSTHLLAMEIPFQFLFLGNGFDEASVQAEMEQSPLKQRFHCLGYRNDSLSVVAACDGIVLPSTHGESMTKSVIEAMCLCIPPIITDIPGNNGLVEDGQSGWVVPIKDPTAIAGALTDLALSKQERIRRGQNAKEHIRKNFHTDRTVEGYLNLYQRLRR